MSTMMEILPANAEVKTGKAVRKETRVAAYARVSTLSAEQEDSYENQRHYFEMVINENPTWTFAGIYADQASGVNTKKRDQFNQMMTDGRKGRFDVLLVKSISRFARNTLTTIECIRELKSAGGVVHFQKEQISTDQPQMEFMLTLMASMAQQESESISLNTTMGFRMKHKDGRWSMRYDNFLGYTKGPEGGLVVIPEEAKVVRMIYDEFLDGTTLNDIAQHLMDKGIRTGGGSTRWTKTGISRLLQNEKYAGDVRLQKYVMEDFMSKKKVENTGQAPMYYKMDDHEAIVDRQLHLLAKGELIRRANECVKGPKLNRHRNDYTSKIICPVCGNHYNRLRARDKYNWTCYGRVNSDCAAPIIKEELLNDATVQALQMLWDMKPEYKPEKVPKLKVNDPDEKLEAAAITFMTNQFAKRVTDFCRGERPTEYDPEITWRLIERIEPGDGEVKYFFHGGAEVTVNAEIYTAGVPSGRRLGRSEKHDKEGFRMQVSQFNGSNKG